MNKFTYNTEIPLQMLAVLNENKQKIIQIYASETSYKEDDIKLLWLDLETYLNNFNKAFENKQKMWSLEETMYQNFEKKSLYIRKKHGKVLICLPYNAVIPLLPVFIISFCVFGNTLILSPSRKSLQTANFVFSILGKLFQENNFKIELFENGGQEAIKKFVLTKKVDLLFFQGSSRNRNEIYQKCIENSVELIYEGEGNQVTIIDNYIGNGVDITLTAINQSLSFCNGKLCTTPKILFVNSKIFQDFTNTISKNKEECDFVIFDKNIDVNNITDKTILYCSYNNIDDIICCLKNSYDFGLQVSVFSDNPDNIVQNLSANLNIARITVNMNPTFQNSLLPWGGYKKSGYSRVCDFFDKATKTMVIEYN